MMSSHPSSPAPAMTGRRPLLVLAKYHPGDIAWHADGEPVMDDEEVRNDGWDDFNHPRYRRLIILRELAERSGGGAMSFERVGGDDSNTNSNVPKQLLRDATNGDDETNRNPLDAYLKVHSRGLVDFLSTAWHEWDSLGEKGQDPNSSLNHRRPNAAPPPPSGPGEVADHGTSSAPPPSSSTAGASVDAPPPAPAASALVPGNAPLPREAFQRPSRNVMGRMGYFCTDTCTPVFGGLLEELLADLEIIERAVGIAAVTGALLAPPPPSPVVYTLCTHPGHHAAHDSFGGYCYFNNAALAARLLQHRLASVDDPSASALPKVAILDVDYHCGNGTTSIFYDDPSVLVVSIHCHPDYDYPFHTGYDDEVGTGDGLGTTMNIPLLPGTAWQGNYETALQRAMEAICEFGPSALVVSLGLDTHKGDPCAIRRAGFELEGDDYDAMGQAIGRAVKTMEGEGRGAIGETEGSAPSSPLTHNTIPVIVVQEGGYKMDKVPSVTANFLLGIVGSI
jgi:acetoin utilization deacetylase AcuC-like enzyme